ncbi:GntR family transcriptional regulator [Herbiconiux sp.]|uniref:GntR family transcriptional regulator n=1 Tax=Herbiconiux sp. TaxID=1871186 RepID=UPI0025BD1F2B|nr:GntR family transcriptional regulator [Herbiconiux sp.]
MTSESQHSPTSPSHSGVIRRGTVSGQTEAILRDMVLDGTLAPGERLNEVTIADSLGVSRGPLREAIQKLAGEGLLQLQSHRGAFVRKYEPREIIEAYELRIALELYAVRLVIARAGDDELAALRVLLDADPRPAPAQSDVPLTAGPYVAELDFHQSMVTLSGNSALTAASLTVNHRLYLALTHTERTQARREHAHGEHQAFLEALCARDTPLATSLLEKHLELSLANTLTVLGLEPRSDGIQAAHDDNARDATPPDDTTEEPNHG